MQQALTAALVDKCLKITEKEVRNHLRNVCVKKIGILFPELDEDVRTKTADYALIQVASERDRADMIKNLQSILGPYTANFVDWLMVIIRTLSRKTAEVKFDVVHSDVKDHVKSLGQELSNASAARSKATNKEEAAYNKSQAEIGSRKSSSKLASGRGGEQRGENRERDQLHLDNKAPAVVAARRHLDNNKAGFQRRNSGGGNKDGRAGGDNFAVPFSPRHVSGKKPAADDAAPPPSAGGQRRRRHSASPRDSTMPRESSADYAGKPPPDDIDIDRRQDKYDGPRRRHSISPTPMIDRTHDYEYYNDISYGRGYNRQNYDSRRNNGRSDGYGGDRGPQGREFDDKQLLGNSNNARYDNGSGRYAGSSSNRYGGGRNQRRSSLDREWTPFERRWSPSFEPPPRSYYSRLYQEKIRNYNYYRRGNSPLHVVEYRNDRRPRGFDYLPTRDVHTHAKHIISVENKNQIRSVIGCVIGGQSSSVTTTSAADTTTANNEVNDQPQNSFSDVGFKRPTMPIHSRLGSKPYRPQQQQPYRYPHYEQEVLPYSRRDARNPSEISQVDSLYDRLDIKPEKIRVTLRQNYIPRGDGRGGYDDMEMNASGYYHGDGPMRRNDDSYILEPPPPRYADEVMMPPPPIFQAPAPVVVTRGERFYTDDELIRRVVAGARTQQQQQFEVADVGASNFIDVNADQRSQTSYTSKRTANTSVSKRPVSSVAGSSSHAHHCCSCMHTPQHGGDFQQAGGSRHAKHIHHHHHPQHSPIASVNGDDDDIISIHSCKRTPAAAVNSGSRSTKGAPSIVAVSTVSKRRRLVNNNEDEPMPQQRNEVEEVRQKKKSSKQGTSASLHSQRLSLSPMSVDNNEADLQFEPVSPVQQRTLVATLGNDSMSPTKSKRNNAKINMNIANQGSAREAGDVIYLQDFSENDVEELNRHSMLAHSYDPVSPTPNDGFDDSQFQQQQQPQHHGRVDDGFARGVSNVDIHQPRHMQQQQQFEDNLGYNLNSELSEVGSLSPPPPAPPMYVRQQQHRRQQNMVLLNQNNMLMDMPQEISLDIPRALSPGARERIIVARNRELALFDQRHHLQQQQQQQFVSNDYGDLPQESFAGFAEQQNFSSNNTSHSRNSAAVVSRNDRVLNSMVNMPAQQRRPTYQTMPVNSKLNRIMQTAPMSRQAVPSRAAGAAALRQQRQSQPTLNRSTNYYAPGYSSNSTVVESRHQQQLRPTMYGGAKNKYATSYAASAVTAPPIRPEYAGRNPYASTFAAHSTTKYTTNRKLDVLDVGRIIAGATAGAQQQPYQYRTVSGAGNRSRVGTSMPQADTFRPKSAVAAVVAASAAAAESTAASNKPAITKLDSQKLSRLCPWWPLCNRGNYCNNLHPKVSRRCQFGTYCSARSGNCCYQHPHCYFGSQGTCSNLQCPFDHGSANCTEAELELFKKHVAEKPEDAHVVQSPYPPPTTYTKVDWLTDADRELLPEMCQMWLRNKCANPQCSRMHRTKQGCMFHPQCVKRMNNDCPYLHPDEVERFLPINKGSLEELVAVGEAAEVVSAVIDAVLEPSNGVAVADAATMMV